MQSRPTFPRKQVTLLSIIFFCFLFFLFNSCKKNDVIQPSLQTTKDSIIVSNETSFFTISPKVPNVVKTIIAKMKSQLKQNDINDFISWHGYPQWSKIIKFNPQQNGTITYAIPVQKDSTITSFFAATIDKAGNIKFEMHRESAISQNFFEYSFAGFTLNANKIILSYFKGEHTGKGSPQTSSLFCWWAWVATTNFQGGDDQNAVAIGDGGGGHWEINCSGGGGGTSGGGTGEGGGGTGSPGNEPPCDQPEESFANQWWSNQPPTTSLTNCQQDYYDRLWMETNIQDSTLKPCVGNALNTLKQINSKLPAMIRGFFNTNPTFRMKLYSYYTSTPSSTCNGSYCFPEGGQTNAVSQSIDSFDIGINTYYNNATDLSLAATIIHECFHAQLTQWVKQALLNHDTARQHELAALFGSVFTQDFKFDSTAYNIALFGNTQHELIAANYRNIVSQALKEFALKKNINVTTSTCDLLAWAGLVGSQAFNSLSLTQQDYIKDIINAERDPYGATVNLAQQGYHGHPCN